MEPVRLGIIGAGIAARDLHLPALKEIKDKFAIAAVCDNIEEKAQEFAHLAGDVRFTLDYRELLSYPDIEAVDIILPVELNYTAALASLQAGKHVIVEKPLGINLDVAQRMLSLPDRFPGKVMMMAENFRYFPVIQRIRELIAANEIGTPYALVWNVFNRNKLTDKYTKTPWRIEHVYPGGFITDAGIHYIAGIRHMLGDIISGCALTQSINPLIGELDTLSFQFLLKNEVQPLQPPSLRDEGTTASIRISGTNHVAGMARSWADGSIEVEISHPKTGDRVPLSKSLLQGTLNLFYSAYGIQEDQVIVFGDMGTIIGTTGEGEHKVIARRHNKPELEEDMGPDRGYRGEFENFFNAITSGMDIIATFEQSFRDLEILLTVQEAARERKKVTF